MVGLLITEVHNHSVIITWLGNIKEYWSEVFGDERFIF